MFTYDDRLLLQKMYARYDVNKETQKIDYMVLSDLRQENSELKTKVEVYESLIQSFLKHNSDLDDISKIALIYNGEIYRVNKYNLESSKDDVKMLHLDMKCTSPISKNFKEEE